MFKKDINPAKKTKVKSSAQRALRSKLCDSYPLLAPYIDEIIPKKSQLDVMKLPDFATLYSLESHPLFVEIEKKGADDIFLPHLKLVHAFPHCFKRVQIDRGAIRFVLSGAALMAPGLTSPGGRLPPAEEALKPGEVVAVGAEGKDEICLIGILKMGTEEMKEKKKGVVMDEGHYLGDGLWKLSVE
ncbi:PUA domain-containing protein [Xylona heveae TC161]|uniref:Translation machinery-associated protein 20 n=1 Tax=Xylona heveae (strain CBS 132557 / TC161) TaxID=1328760 RepID=A0A165JCT6_XYLHT|nr:PUA domain-containing protein [Xylona heveae TC161]KZF26065.1 PUA domain-containing protein [Xylona heveae TC161]